MAVEEESLVALIKARSLLVILLATCRQTLLALEAASNVLDTDLTADLSATIGRTEGELDVLAEKIDNFGA